MGLASILDLDERRTRSRYGDWNNPPPGSGSAPYGWPASGQAAPPTGVPGGGTVGGYGGSGAQYGGTQNGVYSWGAGTTGASGASANVPEVDPNAYQYGGAPGGAANFNNQLSSLASAQAAQQGAQIDQGQFNPTLGQLSSFYAGQMNGTGPSLAAAQMQQSTDQNVAAQMAAANSAKGGLSSALAQRQAGQTAAGMEQAAAQQSMQGRIAEEYNAAQGMQGVAGAQEQAALAQAQLQQQQQDINARTGLGYAGLQNQVNAEQLEAQMQQQGQMSGNYLAASGMGMNQSQFNTTNTENLAMGAAGIGAGLLMAADADFQEPAGLAATLGPRGRNYADGDMPAHLTLREEHSVDGAPFMLLADQNTGALAKVATQPLSPAERRQAFAPHGAGPIFAQGGARAHTTMRDGDMGLASLAGGLGRRGDPARHGQGDPRHGQGDPSRFDDLYGAR